MSNETVYMPDWLAALRCPILGDLRLSRVWKAPDYIPELLEGFGRRHPPALRWIVVRLDTMADNYWGACNHEPVFDSTTKAKAHFASTASAARNLWNKLQEPQVRQAILMANAKREPTKQPIRKGLVDYDVDETTPLDEIDCVLKFIEKGATEVSRDLDIYYRPLGRRVVDSRKHLERPLLYEPLLDLMHEFRIENFDEYQDLIQTARSLHSALGIDPPVQNYLDQVVFGWRERRLNSAVRFSTT